MKLDMMIAALGLALATPASVAMADTTRTTTFANGTSFTTQVERSREGTSRLRSSTGSGTGPQEAGFDRTAIWIWDPDTKSWTKSVTGQTAKGRSWSNTGSGSCAEGTCSSSATVSGANGKSSNRSSTTNRAEGLTTRTTTRGARQREWKRLR